MYGTVARLKVKAGHWEDLAALNQEWDEGHGAKVAGAIGGIVYKLDNEPDTAILCAIFESKDSYFANADNPEQDKWYQRFREHLDADPEWMDGEIVYAHTTKAL